jgi:hypothetical protein
VVVVVVVEGVVEGAGARLCLSAPSAFPEIHVLLGE